MNWSELPWWTWLAMVAVPYVAYAMGGIMAHEKLGLLKIDVDEKEKTINLLERTISELGQSLNATGVLDYKPEEVVHGQKFWRVTEIKERVVHQSGDKWGVFMVHNKDENGVPTKTEIISLGWVTKDALLEYLRGNLYRIERDDTQDLTDDHEQTPQERFHKQMDAIGLSRNSALAGVTYTKT
jgi:hypothetical protein